MHYINSFKNSGKFYVFLIFSAVFFSWFPTLFVQFLSDDYQIIYWHKTDDFASAFRHLHSPYILDVYWRPLGSISFCLTYLIAGFTPFAFHLGNLLLYALCCIMVFKTGETIGLERTTAFLAAIFFSVLPSHELPVAWLSCRGDTMAALFLLTSAFFYIHFLKDNRILYASMALVSFVAALLSKEIAFAGVAIPLIVLLRFPFKSDVLKRHLRPTIISIVIAMALLAAVLVYRITVIGGSPFDSPHFSSSGPFIWLKNLAMYVPLAFATPEFLERELYDLKNFHPVSIVPVLLAALVLYMIIRTYIRSSSHVRGTVHTGLGWFLIFMIPALPTLMRWYVFTASIGLIWALAALSTEFLKNRSKGDVAFFKTLFTFLLLFLGLNAWNISEKWQLVSEHVETAVHSLNDFKNTRADSIIILAAPDKIERINAMKLGLQQTVQFGLQDFSEDGGYRKGVEVISPLRVESKLNSKIAMTKSGDTVMIEVLGVRLIPENTPSTSILKAEKFEREFLGQPLTIERGAFWRALVFNSAHDPAAVPRGNALSVF